MQSNLDFSESFQSEPIQATSLSRAATHLLGVYLGGLLVPGDVVLLCGELGVGKTVFVSGISEALDVDEPVLSPTFTIVRQIEGKYPVTHVDLYRLNNIGEVESLGLDELVGDEGITLVEWGNKAAPLFGVERLEIELAYKPEGDDAREVRVSGSGCRWMKQWKSVKDLFEKWSGEVEQC